MPRSRSRHSKKRRSSLRKHHRHRHSHRQDGGGVFKMFSKDPPVIVSIYAEQKIDDTQKRVGNFFRAFDLLLYKKRMEIRVADKTIVPYNLEFPEKSPQKYNKYTGILGFVQTISAIGEFLYKVPTATYKLINKMSRPPVIFKANYTEYFYLIPKNRLMRHEQAVLLTYDFPTGQCHYVTGCGIYTFKIQPNESILDVYSYIFTQEAVPVVYMETKQHVYVLHNLSVKGSSVMTIRTCPITFHLSKYKSDDYKPWMKLMLQYLIGANTLSPERISIPMDAAAIPFYCATFEGFQDMLTAMSRMHVPFDTLTVRTSGGDTLKQTDYVTGEYLFLWRVFASIGYDKLALYMNKTHGVTQTKVLEMISAFSGFNPTMVGSNILARQISNFHKDSYANEYKRVLQLIFEEFALNNTNVKFPKVIHLQVVDPPKHPPQIPGITGLVSDAARIPAADPALNMPFYYNPQNPLFAVPNNGVTDQGLPPYMYGQQYGVNHLANAAGLQMYIPPPKP